MLDFIYSVRINKIDASATAMNLKFGVSDNSFWLLKVDYDEQLISIGNHVEEKIKTISHPLLENREYKIDLVVNDKTAKVYVDEGDVSLLTFELNGYEGGDILDNLNESLLDYSGRNIANLNALSGDIFCNGYDVLKVINLSDDNYKLNETEYTINEGVLRIEDSYLNTLENNYEYKFRAVTSFTDLNFYIRTKEVGAQAISLVEKYYRGEDAKFELSEDVTVNQVFVDSNEFEFVQENEIVTIKNEKLNSLASGEHRVKFFTNNGRPEAKFSLYETVEIIPEIPAPVNHAYFFIDISIFAVLILGYVIFSRIKKRQK